MADLAQYFAVDRVVADDLGPRYNVAPTEEVYAIAVRHDETRLGALRWGLVPGWAHSPAVGSRMINARAETLLDKRAFRQPFARRRCLVPADGFYEWQAGEGGAAKQPWYLPSADGSPLAFAGLWDTWRPHGQRRTAGDSEVGRLVSCTVVTTDASESLMSIHPRMPVILPVEAWARWLDPAYDDVEELRGLLVTAPEGTVVPRKVRPLVNAVANDGPALVEPLGGVPPVEEAAAVG